MTIVRSYKGIGALLVGERRLENVNYRLDVFQIRHRLDGRGLLTAESESLSDAALEEAFSRGRAELVLDSGDIVEIGPSELTVSSSGPRMTFLSAGTLPGF